MQLAASDQPLGNDSSLQGARTIFAALRALLRGITREILSSRPTNQIIAASRPGFPVSMAGGCFLPLPKSRRNTSVTKERLSY